MSKKLIFTIVLGALVSSPAFVRAQEPPPDVPPHGDIASGGPLGGRMRILGFEEMHPGKVVAGAPYSAVAVTEHTQTLADGTTIDRKFQANVYRDSQGRSRREMNWQAVGPLAASGQIKSFILIFDPVAGTTYELRPEKKSAVQLPSRMGHRANSGALENKFDARVQQEIANGTLKKEDLGTQTINGMAAQGTRYTRTIPAGQIGNDKPISIVNERWYSPDLQVVVKSTRNDPRFGSITYSLTNVQRQEPAAALFTVPSDYTVTQGHGMRGPRGRANAAPAEATPPSE